MTFAQRFDLMCPPPRAESREERGDRQDESGPFDQTGCVWESLREHGRDQDDASRQHGIPSQDPEQPVSQINMAEHHRPKAPHRSRPDHIFRADFRRLATKLGGFCTLRQAFSCRPRPPIGPLGRLCPPRAVRISDNSGRWRRPRPERQHGGPDPPDRTSMWMTPPPTKTDITSGDTPAKPMRSLIDLRQQPSSTANAE